MYLKNTLKGFTLVELLVAIVVMGVLASISVGMYNGYINEAKTSTVKKTVNDLHRYNLLYAKENETPYSDISLEDLTERFGIQELPYGQISYVANDDDFFFIGTMPSGESWFSAADIIKTTYAQEPAEPVKGDKDDDRGGLFELDTKTIDKYYAAGTPNAIAYFIAVPNVLREGFIVSAYSAELSQGVSRFKVDGIDFEPKIIASPWEYNATDTDGDGFPDYFDMCPEVAGDISGKVGCPIIDTDGDGIGDSEDSCPNDFGTREFWGCPEEEKSDKDGDGVLDEDDACPEEKGSERNKGCPEEEKSDKDGDGVLDEDDACPEEKGSERNKGCPEEEKSDKDGDGVLDEDDACPEEKGSERNKGCPEEEKSDKDGDGVLDEDDACPEEKGSERNKGCPEEEKSDKDGDGVLDEDDACPEEKGSERNKGCPEK